MEPTFQPAIRGFPDAPPRDEAAAAAVEIGPYLSGALAGSLVTGSTSLGTLEAGTELGWRGARVGIGAIGSARLGRGAVDADGSGHLSRRERRSRWVETAKRLEGDLRLDHRLGARHVVYGVAGALTDPFAGFALRTHEQVGLGRLLVDTPTTDLVAELGVDVAQERYVDTVELGDASVVAGRLWVGLAHRFGKVGWRQTVEVFENLQSYTDVRVLHGASLVAPLGAGLALEPTHTLAWDSQPLDGYAALDQTTLLRLVASLR
jgi:hypothetical protein